MPFAILQGRPVVQGQWHYRANVPYDVLGSRLTLTEVISEEIDPFSSLICYARQGMPSLKVL